MIYRRYSRSRNLYHHRNHPRWILKFALLMLFTRTTTNIMTVEGRIFASDNGFDVGGDEPVCWEAVLDTTAVSSSPAAAAAASSGRDGDNILNMTNNRLPNNGQPLQQEQRRNILNVHELNEFLFDEKVVPEFHILASCYEGTTSLQMTPLNLPKSNVMHTGEVFEFELTLETQLEFVNETFIDSTANPQLLEPMEVWLRLLLCKATEVGFCSPFFDVKDQKKIMMNKNKSSETYQQGDVVPGIENMDESHIMTPWISWYLQPQDSVGNYFGSSVNLSFMLDSGTDGIYFMLGHAVMYFFRENVPMAYRVDIADALDGNILQVKSPPVILDVGERFMIVMSIIIALATLLPISMFGMIVYHRHNKLMTLAQGGLLGLMTAAGAIGTGSAFMFYPTNDWFCRLSGPFCLIPQTIVAATLVGRLWRVYMTLSVANTLGRAALKGNGGVARKSISAAGENKPHWWNRPWMPSEEAVMEALGWLSLSRCFPPSTKNGGRGSGGASLRRATTRADTLRLIFMLALPQAVVQVFGGFYYPSSVDTQLDADGRRGRRWCQRAGTDGGWTYLVGLALLGLVYVLAVLVAWFSRNLPSAFNEKDQIFQAASINSIVSMIVISLMFITNDATTDPNVSSFLWIALAISVASVSNWLIVMPKIRRLLSGEKVVISNMLRRVNNLSSSSTTSATVGFGNSFASPEPTPRPPETSRITSIPIAPPDIEGFEVSRPSSKDEENDEKQGASLSRRRKPKIVLNEEDPIPKSVEKEIYSIQNVIQSINEDALHGRPVGLDDWRALKLRAAVLSDEVNRIECDWSMVEDNTKEDLAEDEDMQKP